MPGTEPLYRSLNSIASLDHKLSRIKQNSNDVILGYVYPTKQPGTKPVYNIRAKF